MVIKGFMRMILGIMVLGIGCGNPDASGLSEGTYSNGHDLGEVMGTDIGNSLIQSHLYKSGSRIKARVFVTPGGAQSFSGWHDTQLDVDCHFRVAADGKIRCIPTMNTANLYFKDASCTVPLAYSIESTISNYCHGKIPRWVEFYVYQDECQTKYTVRYYETGQEYTGDVLYAKDSSGNCTKFDKGSGYKCYRFFNLGKEVSPSIFANAQEKTLN